MSNVLKLGIPRGSLEKATIELFEKSGWRIKLATRSYFPEVDDEELACSICRAQEMSRYVDQGILDGGITGKDWILENESDVVVVEDLVSTGGSSLKAVEALRDCGTEVMGMVAIFSYGFYQAVDNFRKAGVRLYTLTNYDTMIQVALETGYIHENQLKMLTRWREDPSSWAG